MGAVFISYAREDQRLAEQLRNLLSNRAHDVWWDQDIEVGTRWQESIESALRSATAVIVIWSSHSVNSTFVTREAEFAQERALPLLPVLAEAGVSPPLGFRGIQWVDLSDWDGDPSHRSAVQLVEAVQQLKDTGSFDEAGPAFDATAYSYPTAAVEERLRQIARSLDEPAQIDTLNRRPLATVVATRLNAMRADARSTSVAALVDGPWGSGKSTLLNLIGQEFLPPSHEAGWLFVRFDAWRQERVGPPWWALMEALRHDVYDAAGWRRRMLLRLQERLASTPSTSRAAALVLIAVVAIGLAAVGASWDGIESTAAGFMTGVGAITALWGGAIGIGRLMTFDSVRGAEHVVRSTRNPMEEVAKRFLWLVKAARRPVIIAIDDLDRCEHEYVVELLDAVQTLTRNPVPSAAASEARVMSRIERRRLERGTRRRDPGGFDLFVLVAADSRWIGESYQHHHQVLSASVDEPGRRLGHLFIAKLFHFTVTVPDLPADARDGYLAELLSLEAEGTEALHQSAETLGAELREAGSAIRLAQTEDEILRILSSQDRRLRHMLSEQVLDRLAAADLRRSTNADLVRYGSLLRSNPRTLKRFVFDYGISRAIRTVEGSTVGTEPLALWSVLRVRWPAVADSLQRDPSLVEAWRRGDDPGSALSAALELDGDLEEALNFGGPGLTADLISAASGTG